MASVNVGVGWSAVSIRPTMATRLMEASDPAPRSVRSIVTVVVGVDIVPVE